MSDKELIMIVKRMRRYQVAFFKGKAKGDLAESKKLEKMVDDEFERRDSKQGNLFN